MVHCVHGNEKNFKKYSGHSLDRENVFQVDRNTVNPHSYASLGSSQGIVWWMTFSDEKT